MAFPPAPQDTFPSKIFLIPYLRLLLLIRIIQNFTFAQYSFNNNLIGEDRTAKWNLETDRHGKAADTAVLYCSD